MPAQLIDGKEMAKAILSKAKQDVDQLLERGARPSLAVIQLGEDPASNLYIEKKKIACQAIGIEFDYYLYGENSQQKDLLNVVNELNHKFNTHGILVQLPLPKQLDTEKVLNTISPIKDVDGFTAFNLGLLEHGKEGLVSCTAQAILKLIEGTGVKVEGTNACIVNHSVVVGRPLASLLLNRGATVTVCHKHTRDLAEHTKKADILVTAVGKPGLIRAGMVKPGAVVIDAGINRQSNRVLGDLDFEAVKEVASFITPVPGGVGPMTVACLMHNTVKAAVMQHA
jgi:methylenetetrahydrofolate dehydrogenase (NADP+)/methenyltetrahydrofolate cyclohydrolase